MEKEKKSKCLCAMWCICYACLFNALIFCFLIIEELNLGCSKMVIYVALFVINLVCAIMTNVKVQSEKDDINTKLEQFTCECKGIVRSQLSSLFNDSFNKDVSLSKTLEMITETFDDKNCDDAKLKTLKVVIDAVMKSHEKDQQTLCSEQGQEKGKNN